MRAALTAAAAAAGVVVSWWTLNGIGAMMPGELEPPVAFAGKHARDLQDQSREFRRLVILMPGERLKASNILRRDHRLM